MIDRLYIVANQIYTPYETLALNLPSPLWQGSKHLPEFAKLFQRDISFKGVDGALIASADIQSSVYPESPLGKSRLWIDYEESGATVVEAPVTLTLSFPRLDRSELMTMSSYYMEFIFPKVSYYMVFNDDDEEVIDKIDLAMGRRKRGKMEIATDTFYNAAWEEKKVVFPYERSILAQGIKFRVVKFNDNREEYVPDPTPSAQRRLVLV